MKYGVIGIGTVGRPLHAALSYYHEDEDVVGIPKGGIVYTVRQNGDRQQNTCYDEKQPVSRHSCLRGNGISGGLASMLAMESAGLL